MKKRILILIIILVALSFAITLANYKTLKEFSFNEILKSPFFKARQSGNLEDLVIIGSPKSGGGSNTPGGEVYAYMPNGSQLSLLWTINTGLGFSHLFFGYSILVIPDLNGDKYPEVVVGNTWEYVGNESWEKKAGGAHIFSGKDGVLLRDLESGAIRNDEYGRSLKWAPNDDGSYNILIGSPYIFGTTHQDLGAVCSFSPLGNLLWKKEGGWPILLGSQVNLGDEPPTGFGKSFAGIKDINNDGLGDVAILLSEDENTIGQIKMLSGNDSSVIWEINGSFEVEISAVNGGVESIKDTNSDGVADIIAIRRENIPGSFSWNISVFSGVNGNMIWDKFLQELNCLNCNTFDTKAIPDINGDGIQDIVTGSKNPSTEVKALSGINGNILWSMSSPSGTGFGQAISSTVDLNNDGVPEILVSNPTASTPKVYVLSGMNGNIIDEISPSSCSNSCRFGNSISSTFNAIKWQ